MPTRIRKELYYARKRLRWALRNSLSAARMRWDPSKPIANLNRYEKRFSSQNGEDGLIEAIFSAIGETNRFFVEFGVGDGSQCNTNHLAGTKGWKGLMMDRAEALSPAGIPVRAEFVTAENVEALFFKHSVPETFDLLSIDIDGNDYWVWKAIRSFRPRVVVIEYNASVPPDCSRTIAYDPEFRWERTDYFGASLLALKKLGVEKGYTLVACDNSGTNAFLVATALVPGKFVPKDAAKIYRPPAYRQGKGHPPDGRRSMIPV